MKFFTSLLNWTAIICLSIVSFGCSSSSSDSAPATTSVSGVVFAGPAVGTSVTAKTTAGVVVAGPVTSAADGTYTISIPNSVLSSDVVIEATGGTYTDEATGTTGVSLGTFSVYIDKNTLNAGTNVTIDPSTTIIRELIRGGKTRAAAESAFNSSFGYTPDSTIKPVFAGISSASTTPQRLAGVRAAAFSQLTNDLGIPATKQSEVVLALANDLSDGVLDGIGNGGTAVSTASNTAIPADIGVKFNQALFNFEKNSSRNKSKLTIDNIGNLAFNKVALTTSYKVEYVPGMTAAAQGKTTFQVKLTNRSDGSAATGKSLTLMPTMYMPGMTHSAPVDTVVESSTPGTYNCTVYYLMASGAGMGIWQLNVMIGMETATFYPPVAMAMGTTSRATLKGVADVIGSMMGMGTSSRTYYLFNDGSTFGMTSTFKLFLAVADDSMMMKFPAVYGGSTLHDAMNMAWTVNAATSGVQVSSDGGSTWVTATDNGGGHWSAAGLSGLASGGTVRVKVTINGEQKTSDGTGTGLNYATFTIVAGM